MLYHVQATFNPGVELRTFQHALNSAHSWFRLSGTSWIVCSPNENAWTWMQRLKPYTQPSGTLLVSRLNPEEYQGFMTNEFWTWFREHMNH